MSKGKLVVVGLLVFVLIGVIVVIVLESMGLLGGNTVVTAAPTSVPTSAPTATPSTYVAPVVAPIVAPSTSSPVVVVKSTAPTVSSGNTNTVAPAVTNSFNTIYGYSGFDAPGNDLASLPISQVPNNLMAMVLQYPTMAGWVSDGQTLWVKSALTGIVSAPTTKYIASLTAMTIPNATPTQTQITPGTFSPAAFFPPGVYTTYTNYDLGGSDVSSMAASPADCLNACTTNAACSYVVTDNTGAKCWLKNNPTTWRQTGDGTVYASPRVASTFALGSTLANGSWIYQDGTAATAATSALRSPDGRYMLYLQNDGNVCLRRSDNNKQCWCAGTGGGSPPYKLIMQQDSHLVIYSKAKNDGSTGSAAGTPIWGSGTNGKGAVGSAIVTLQNDGNFTMYSSGKAIWATNTVGC